MSCPPVWSFNSLLGFCGCQVLLTPPRYALGGATRAFFPFCWWCCCKDIGVTSCGAVRVCAKGLPVGSACLVVLVCPCSAVRPHLPPHLVSLLVSSPSSSASSWRTASCECGSVGNAVPRVPVLWTLGRLSITAPPSWPLCCLGTGGFCFERGKTQEPKLTLSQVLHIQEGILNNYVSVFSEKGLRA